jgi:hypothetical protein
MNLHVNTFFGVRIFILPSRRRAMTNGRTFLAKGLILTLTLSAGFGPIAPANASLLKPVAVSYTP